MHVAIPYRPDHVQQAQWLLAETRRNDGLAPVDLGRFWHDQDIAIKNPFGCDIPQVALGAMMSGAINSAIWWLVILRICSALTCRILTKSKMALDLFTP